MSYLEVTLILIIVMLGVLGYFVWRGMRKRQTTAKDELLGICEVALETASQKRMRKQKIADLLKEKGALSNSEIRKALEVSSRTVVRYLDELEAEGKVEQVGKTGNAVTYRLK